MNRNGEKLCDATCKDCVYSGDGSSHEYNCLYILYTGKRRPCPPGIDCTVKRERTTKNRMGAYYAVIEFKIAYPPEGKQKNGWCKRYGLNKYWAGVHWGVRKSDAEYWHMLVTSALNAIHLPETALPFDVPVLISFYWNDGLDIDNHAAMGKMIVDSLKHRIIKDDNRRNLKGVFHLWHDQGNYIRIVIKPLQKKRREAE